MNENEKYENAEELLKQKVEYIKKKGGYIDFRIVIPSEEIDEEPISTMEVHKASLQDISKAIAIIKVTLKSLEEKYPMESLMADLMVKSDMIGCEDTQRFVKDL